MIRKYTNANVSIDLTSNGLADSPEYAGMLEEIKECESMTGLILEQYAKIDTSIREFRESINKVSENIGSFANNLLEGVGNMNARNNDDALGGLIIGASALAIAGGAALLNWGGNKVAERKERKAKEERDAKLEAALEEKQKIADAKYGPLKRFKDRISESIYPRINTAYDKDFEMRVESGDPLFQKKFTLFKRDLALLAKTQFMVGTLDYLLSEMAAWKEGKHDSGGAKPSPVKILEGIIESWPERLGIHDGWDSFVESQLFNDTGQYPVAAALLFTEPALLSNYVGINFSILNNCKSGIIFAEDNELDADYYPAGELISKNPYYLDCKRNLENNFKPPHWPNGFGIKDIIIITIPIILAFLLSLLTFMIFPGTFVRILGITLVVALVVCSFSMFLGEDLGIGLPYIPLPYDKAYDDYSMSYDQMIETIKDQENKARKEYSKITV